MMVLDASIIALGTALSFALVVNAQRKTQVRIVFCPHDTSHSTQTMTHCHLIAPFVNHNSGARSLALTRNPSYHICIRPQESSIFQAFLEKAFYVVVVQWSARFVVVSHEYRSEETQVRILPTTQLIFCIFAMNNSFRKIFIYGCVRCKFAEAGLGEGGVSFV